MRKDFARSSRPRRRAPRGGSYLLYWLCRYSVQVELYVALRLRNCLTNAWYQVHPAGSLVPHILWSFCPCFLLRPLLQSYSTSRRRLGKRADENHDHRNDCPAKLYPRALLRISPPHVALQQ